MLSYVVPHRYVADVEKAGTPLVAAIDAYVSRVGYPPEQLSDLLPEFDAAQAGTGFPRQSVFDYRRWRTGGKGPNNPWALIVWVEAIALDCDVIQFDSTKRTWEFVVVHYYARSVGTNAAESFLPIPLAYDERSEAGDHERSHACCYPTSACS